MSVFSGRLRNRQDQACAYTRVVLDPEAIVQGGGNLPGPTRGRSQGVRGRLPMSGSGSSGSAIGMCASAAIAPRAASTVQFRK
ncbi:hypothetical protein [Streptomyces sp. SID3343]|uniref:hypothetical protein n=1 Tax=Streptomyces sp. SID3343 TaxID=2690260 RepID=UPI001371A6AC|nr:hypothetical protein [Streptomyces sp. SID3343]MYW06708.1 hypothetical protein [Streptomyces sp. SID3343]